MQDSNALLVKRFRENDERAFSKLVGRHYSLVFQVCLKILGHRQDAEDATQETFSRFAKYLDRWDTRRPLEPWLVTIAGNRSKTFLAKRRYHQPLSKMSEPVTDEMTASRQIDGLREELVLALAQVPDRQKTACELFHEQSLSYAEIAEHLGCPVGTAKTWVHRARMSVIQILQQREVLVTCRHRDARASGNETQVTVNDSPGRTAVGSEEHQ